MRERGGLLRNDPPDNAIVLVDVTTMALSYVGGAEEAGEMTPGLGGGGGVDGGRRRAARGEEDTRRGGGRQLGIVTRAWLAPSRCGANMGRFDRVSPWRIFVRSGNFGQVFLTKKIRPSFQESADRSVTGAKKVRSVV